MANARQLSKNDELDHTALGAPAGGGVTITVKVSQPPAGTRMAQAKLDVTTIDPNIAGAQPRTGERTVVWDQSNNPPDPPTTIRNVTKVKNKSAAKVFVTW